MSEYEQKPVQAKAKVAPTAGPAQDDRYGAGKVGSNMNARIIGVNVVGGMAQITIAHGTTHGAHAGMEGYIKSASGMLADFQLSEAREAISYANVEGVTQDQLAGNLYVVINPTSKNIPRKAITAPESTRVIAADVVNGRTRITIARGSSHGVAVGMRGSLQGNQGESGEDFTIDETSTIRSHAYVTATPDQATARPHVVLHPMASAGGAIQRRANGSPASSSDVQATARAGVAGANSRLPHFDTIQRSFGKHDISNIQAQVGGAATKASRALGAQAYATGNKVAFASAPDLHTAAHEAAHVIQQSRGAVGFQGLGAADDVHERHADAVADAVVAGQSAESLLDQISDGAATAVIQRKGAVHESNEHKEPSWVRPAVSAAEQAHVGSIFFRTKQASLEPMDHELLRALAEAYSADSKRNLGQPGKRLGLTGKVVGFADPRRAYKPNNVELANHRADAVATGLERALVNATRLEIGLLHMIRHGAGVDPDAQVDDGGLAEGNTLAPYRRADIYVSGSASPERTASSTKEEATPKPAATGLQPAPALTLDHDRWMPYIMQGNKKIIEGLAARIAVDVGPNSMTGGRAGFAQWKTGFQPEQPPWWAGRASHLAHLRNPPSMGRSATRNASETTRSQLVHDALLLLRDYKEIHFFEEKYMLHSKDAQISADENQRALRYLTFMYSETEKLAWRVHGAAND